MRWLFSFEVWGEAFRPSLVPFAFTEQHDHHEVIAKRGRYRDQLIPYGSASYLVPSEIPVSERIDHIVQTMEPLIADIRAAGATDYHISIVRFYRAQCNEEYSLENLQLIVRLGCGFVYSAYTEDDDEVLDVTS